MNYWIRRLAAAALFYPSLLYNLTMVYVLKRWHWWDRINEKIIVGARPSAKTAQQLSKDGINAVVNTCQEYEGPVAAYRELKIEQLHIPTVDFTPPELEDVVQAVDYVDQKIAEGKQVYIHCKAGRARSATIALCWLIKNENLTAEEAQQYLLSKRRQILKSVYRRQVVRDYINYLEDSAS